MIHFILYKVRKNRNCILENIIFLSPWKRLISFVSRRIFNRTTYFSFWVMFLVFVVGHQSMLRYSSNYYYNLHVFFKLKVSIFLVEPEYLRSEMIHNKIKQSNTFLSCCHTALFQCPGNITDNVVMASWRCLKQLSFTTELNIICENHVDL